MGKWTLKILGEEIEVLVTFVYAFLIQIYPSHILDFLMHCTVHHITITFLLTLCPVFQSLALLSYFRPVNVMSNQVSLLLIFSPLPHFTAHENIKLVILISKKKFKMKFLSLGIDWLYIIVLTLKTF